MLNIVPHFIFDLAVIATEVHVDDAISYCLFLLFTLALPLRCCILLLQLLVDGELVFVWVEAALVLLEGILEVVGLSLCLLIDVGKVVLDDGLQFLLHLVCLEHAVEHLEVRNHGFETLVPSLQHCPLLQPFDLIHTPVHEVVEQLLKLILRTVVDQLLLEDLLQFVLVGVFNELIQLLAIDVHDNLLEVPVIDPILEGEDEVDGLAEVALEHYLLEELNLLAVEGEADLDGGGSTPVSR